MEIEDKVIRKIYWVVLKLSLSLKAYADIAIDDTCVDISLDVADFINQYQVR